MTIKELGEAIMRETDPDRKRELLDQYRRMSAMTNATPGASPAGVK